MADPANSNKQPLTGVAWWVGELPARILSVIACVMLFSMMVVTFVDVAGRYLFSSPLPAAYEIISLIMPVIIFCALPLTNLHEGHVTIDLLDSVIPKSWRRWQGVLVDLFAAGATGFVAWRLMVRSRDHFRFSEVTDELYLEKWPMSAMMAVLCTIAALCFLVNAWAKARGHGYHHRDDEFIAT